MGLAPGALGRFPLLFHRFPIKKKMISGENVEYILGLFAPKRTFFVAAGHVVNVAHLKLEILRLVMESGTFSDLLHRNNVNLGNNFSAFNHLNPRTKSCSKHNLRDGSCRKSSLRAGYVNN